MWDFCPKTLLGLGPHSYSEWRPFKVQDGEPYRWDIRRCSRCGKTDYRRVPVPQSIEVNLSHREER